MPRRVPEGWYGGGGPRASMRAMGVNEGPRPRPQGPPQPPWGVPWGGGRVYLWRTPPAWGSGLGSAYARTLGNKPENVPGAELLRHHTF